MNDHNNNNYYYYKPSFEVKVLDNQKFERSFYEFNRTLEQSINKYIRFNTHKVCGDIPWYSPQTDNLRIKIAKLRRKISNTKRRNEKEDEGRDRATKQRAEETGQRGKEDLLCLTTVKLNYSVYRIILYIELEN